MATQNAIGSNKPIEVAFGGSGAATFTDHGVLVGAATAAFTALAVGTNGQVVVGSTGADPVFANITSTDSSLTITEGAGTLVIEGTAASEIQIGSIELATDAEALAGADTVRAIVPTSLKAKLGTQTDHGVLVGSGTAAAVTALSVGTNGQVIIGSTGADPVFATMTSSGGTVTFTPGAGTLNLEAAGGGGGGAAEIDINAQTGTTYTLVIGDATKLVTLDNGATVTVTVPPNASVAFDVGTRILFSQKGFGQVIIAEGSGVTISSEYGKDVLLNRFSVATIVKIATDVWYLYGEIQGKLPYFEAQTSNIVSDIEAVSFDGTYWAAGGTGGLLTTSTDTVTWTSEGNVTGGATIFTLGWDGTYWVAAGASGMLYTATDPTGAWTSRTSNLSTDIRKVFYGGGLWVAVALTGDMATATDPTGTWTDRTGISSFGTDDILGVGYDGTTWVACGENGTLATSTDPTSAWTQRTTPTTLVTVEFNSVFYGGNVWLCATDDGILSPRDQGDPTSDWIVVSQMSSLGAGIPDILAIHYANGVWVGVGDSGNKIYSQDPLNGNIIQADDCLAGGTANDIHADPVSRKWVIVGPDNKIDSGYY